MKLSPREKDKLLISMAAMVARNRKERGVKLNLSRLRPLNQKKEKERNKVHKQAFN